MKSLQPGMQSVVSQCPQLLGLRSLHVFLHCHKGMWTFPSCWLHGSKVTVPKAFLAGTGLALGSGFVTITGGHRSCQGQSMPNARRKEALFILFSG